MMMEKPGFRGLDDQVSMPVPDIFSPIKDVGDKYRERGTLPETGFLCSFRWAYL